MREIVLDTETTGFDPLTGDRIVEIGCVEVINYIPTDNQLHLYINPERDMPPGAFAVHGLSEEFLRDKPVFAADLRPVPGFHRRLAAGYPQRRIRHAVHQCRVGPARHQAAADVAVARHRRHGKAEVPRRSRQPGRAVPALRHRQLQPHAPRRSARRPASGRGLSGTPGRSSARPCAGRQPRAKSHATPTAAPSRSSASAANRAPMRRRRRSWRRIRRCWAS